MISRTMKRRGRSRHNRHMYGDWRKNMNTVGMLMEHLQKFPKDMPVYVLDGYADNHHTLTELFVNDLNHLVINATWINQERSTFANIGKKKFVYIPSFGYNKPPLITKMVKVGWYQE